MKKKSFIDKLIYHITKKLDCYKEVKNPPQTVIEKLMRPQDARQVQYNNWSKAHKVYSGSYLPKQKNALLNRGWTKQNVGNDNHQVLQRKSTKQTVRYDNHSNDRPHAHWLCWWKKNITPSEYRKLKNRDYSCEKVYYNKYGELTTRKNPDHHIYFEEQDND